MMMNRSKDLTWFDPPWQKADAGTFTEAFDFWNLTIVDEKTSVSEHFLNFAIRMQQWPQFNLQIRWYNV